MSGNPTELMRWAKYTVETYSSPDQFKSPQEFAEALTEVLDELTVAFGAQPPKIEGAWNG